MSGPSFARHIGIDYSGAETPTSSLKGLRVYQAGRESLPTEVLPPPSPRKYWTRRGIAEWLVERLTEDIPIIVGIDHAFSFPLRYFEVHHLLPDWPSFLEDFYHHWPTDGDHIYVDFVRDGVRGDGEARSGSSRWRRLTEERAGSAKSVFHFDVPGTVAKSTHAGLLGCATCARNWTTVSTSGPLMAGRFRLGVRPSSKFIRLYGSGVLPVKIARLINMMPMSLPAGCGKPILMALSLNS